MIQSRKRTTGMQSAAQDADDATMMRLMRLRPPADDISIYIGSSRCDGLVNALTVHCLEESN